MGQYTAFMVKCTVKNEYISFIQDMYQFYQEDPYTYQYKIIKKYSNPIIKDWFTVSRFIMIPFGSGDFEYESFDHEGLMGNLWQFTCSLKDYDYTINHFISTILKLIVEKIEICRKWYCEFDNDEDLIPFFEKESKIIDIY